jgi:prepilin-type N-terminal cleavage/methylation domain-containing protein
MKNKGFTLIEVLIAASIFAMVSMIGATIFMNISQTERKTSLSNAIYEDARVIMEMLAREIRNGTIDYEEYYSVNVLEAEYYGVNRGVYGSRFYDPGYKYNGGDPVHGNNPEDLGTTCFDQAGNPGSCDSKYTILFPLSVDKNMGKNFWNKATPSENAFCDNGKGICDGSMPDELYLISADGREKTILIKQQTATNDYALSMIRLEGIDKDTNGVVDIFTCESSYNCSSVDATKFKHPSSPSYADIKLPSTTINLFDINNSSFIPISPLRSSIEKLEFYISPKEDPYKAFSEAGVQYQPYVTIVLTLKPSEKEKANYPGNPPKITVQTTVSAGVKQKITTYPPTKDLNWIQNVPNLP